MDSRSKPYFFSFNSKLKPGKIICHCVRVETIEVPLEGFDNTNFALLGSDVDEDKRVKHMLQCAYKFWKANFVDEP